MKEDNFIAEYLIRKWTGQLGHAEKDPASAPTLPGHGSTHRRHDMPMNGSEHTPLLRQYATAFAYERAYDDLESPISQALSSINAASWVAAILIEKTLEPSDHYTLSRKALETIVHLVFQAEEAVKAVDDLWLESHNRINRERAA